MGGTDHSLHCLAKGAKDAPQQKELTNSINFERSPSEISGQLIVVVDGMAGDARRRYFISSQRTRPDQGQTTFKKLAWMVTHKQHFNPIILRNSQN